MTPKTVPLRCDDRAPARRPARWCGPAACRRPHGSRPRRRRAATAKCTWLGVTMETKSMRSSAPRRSSSASRSCQRPWLRSSRRPRSRPEARARSGVGRQRAGHQLDLAVQRHRLAVHGADEGARPAAHHRVAQLARHEPGHPALLGLVEHRVERARGGLEVEPLAERRALGRAVHAVHAAVFPFDAQRARRSRRR